MVSRTEWERSSLELERDHRRLVSLVRVCVSCTRMPVAALGTFVVITPKGFGWGELGSDTVSKPLDMVL